MLVYKVNLQMKNIIERNVVILLYYDEVEVGLSNDNMGGVNKSVNVISCEDVVIALVSHILEGWKLIEVFFSAWEGKHFNQLVGVDSDNWIIPAVQLSLWTTGQWRQDIRSVLGWNQVKNLIYYIILFGQVLHALELNSSKLSVKTLSNLRSCDNPCPYS